PPDYECRSCLELRQGWRALVGRSESGDETDIELYPCGVAMMKRRRRRSQPLFSQVVHNVWTLVLVAWAAGSLKRSLSDALRARGQHAAPLMQDNPDALDFFSPDGRFLVRLLSASLGYGVVLYQLTVPYALAVRGTKPPADYGPCGPRCC
ncbi:unnamed protein product, partial [Ixodes persulcatus]